MGRWELGGEQSANACLNTLPPKDYRRVTSAGEIVELEPAQVLHEMDGPVAFVWFPLSAIVSLQLVLQVGGDVEIDMVGREGMIGVPLFLGADRMSCRALVQIPGSALRVDAETFRPLLGKVASFRTVMQRYTEAVLWVFAQNLGCIRSHTIAERAARWLLLTNDRVGSDRFHVKQGFLAQMLQVRRASVSEAQSRLQQQGYIRYSRGTIDVLDRDGLETLTCECYWAIRRRFEQRVHVQFR